MVSFLIAISVSDQHEAKDWVFLSDHTPTIRDSETRCLPGTTMNWGGESEEEETMVKYGEMFCRGEVNRGDKSSQRDATSNPEVLDPALRCL